MRYGMPYKGSKNAIAPFIIKNIPAADNLYDLFAGGCAVSHAAIESGKFGSIFINDISDYPGLFLKAINGGYRNEKRWISREDFFRLKDSEPYIRYCWSFGNNGKNYLYSKEVEPWKKAVHYARVFGDFSLLREFGIETDDASSINVKKHSDEWKEKYIIWYCKEVLNSDLDVVKLRISLQRLQGIQSLQRLQGLERLQRLESLQRLQSLQSLEVSRKSYDDVEILPGSVIYCDIPYKGTDAYIGGFDHGRFYEWCARQKELVLISEYSMTEGFIEVAGIEKRVTMSSGSNKTQTEKLFIPNHQKELWERMSGKRRREWVQPELFNFEELTA